MFLEECCRQGDCSALQIFTQASAAIVNLRGPEYMKTLCQRLAKI